MDNLTGNAATAEGYITDANDATHYNVSLSDMQKILIEMLGAFAKAHSQKQSLRAKIVSCTSIDEVNAIAWISL
jgi:hypothetical protein